MNSYHKNHPDPEVRKKYEEWEASYNNYQARAAGFKDAEHQKGVRAVETEEKKARENMLTMLGRIGANVAFNLKNKKTQTNVSAQKKFKGGGRGRRGS